MAEEPKNPKESTSQKLEVLKYLHEKALGQWNERRKYEWMALIQFFVSVGALASVILSDSVQLEICARAAFVVCVFLAASAIIWFLWEVQKKNASDDVRIKIMHNGLVDLLEANEPNLQATALKFEGEYKTWSLGPQVLFILAVIGALLVVFWPRLAALVWQIYVWLIV